MERYSDNAIEIINDLHTERLAYNSEYIQLIDAAQALSDYEDTGLSPTEIKVIKEKLEEKERACKLAIDKLDKVTHKLISAEKKLAERKPVVRAHWSRKVQRWGEVSYACSACGCVWYFTSGDPAKGFSARYCPDCGATMDKEFKQI